MGKLIFSIFMFMASSMCFSEELVSPLLNAAEVLKKVENYLVKEKSIKMAQYRLTAMSFSNFNINSERKGNWVLDFGCNPGNNIVPSDCGFSVSVSNLKEPNFQFRSYHP